MKKFMGQGKDSLIKQKKIPHTEVKENKKTIFHFPSEGDVQPLLRK